MSFMLDTNIVSKIISGRFATVRDHYVRALDGGIALRISSVVLHELLYGVRKSANPDANWRKLEKFVSGLAGVEVFSADDAEQAADVRAYLASRGELVGPYDLLIAAQALRLGATIVTGNVREFSRVPDLKWADWTIA